MAERWFLELDGIPGESTDAAHVDHIVVESWSWGVSQSGSFIVGGGGGGAGKPQFEDFQFVSRISRASPELFLACASGRHIKRATLRGVRGSGSRKHAFLTYEFEDVLVSSFQQGDTASDTPHDRTALRYGKVRVDYVRQTHSGASDPPVTAGWDIKTNTKL